MKDGFGVETTKLESGDTIYKEGTWKEDKLHGEGRVLTLNEKGEAVLEYVGTIKNGTYTEHGELVSKSGYEYTGEFKDGFKHGRGIIIYRVDPLKNLLGDSAEASFKYEGDWQNDKMHG